MIKKEDPTIYCLHKATLQKETNIGEG
jgi:hypothetical protein